MDSSQTWVEALNISPESLSQWSAETPEGTPLLVWCLQQRYISAEAYLAWACEHFGLPVLANEFFQQGQDFATLKGDGTDSPWSAWYFPVNQWDDVTTVACVEPPSEPPTGDGRFSFVLADPRAMLQAVNPEPASDMPADDLEGPMGIKAGHTSTFILNLKDLQLKDDSDHEKDQDAGDSQEENHAHSASEIEEPSESEEAMDELVEESQAAEPIDPRAVSAPGENTGMTLSLMVNPLLAQEKSPQTPPPPPGGSPPPLKPAPKAAGQPTVRNTAEETEVNAAFRSLKEDYQSSLIMICNNGAARPYRWDADLDISAASPEVRLNAPSFFRIVTKTEQPYHGFVIDSTLHREFFESLKIKPSPACVTAIPLKVSDKIWGILVAFGGDSSKKSESLEKANKISSRLVRAMGAHLG